MHPLAYAHLKRVLEAKEVVGPDESCEYYPCHSPGHDCTWCFCPFYPCEDEKTGGEWVTRKDGSLIWGCLDCEWIHRADVAKAIMVEFITCGIEHVEDIETKSEEVKRIFLILKERYPPAHEK
jgi:Zn-finger protein